jgi:putative endonuclease
MFSLFFFAAMFYVYILFSKSSDRFYIGHTNDVARRLTEHNNPVSGKKYSAKHKEWDLVYSVPVSDSRSDAFRVERFFKKQKSREFILKLIENRDNSDYCSHLLNHILN